MGSQKCLQVVILVATTVTDCNVAINLHYLGSSLNATSASNIAHTFANAIRRTVTSLELDIPNLDLFTLRDWEQIRHWNASMPSKVSSCIHDLMLQHATTSPEAKAICSWDGEMSFAELDQISFKLAQYIVSKGIGPEVLVPICFHKSKYAVITMIAINRAGGAFIPLGPSHPKSRIRAIIEKAEAQIVVTSSELSVMFEDMGVSVLPISSDLWEHEHFIGTTVLDGRVKPDNAAFVLFTSGGTGQPKGIVQEHASVCTNSIAHGRAMGMTASSRVLQYAAYTFDVSMMDIFTTLIYSGCVCIPSEEDRLSNLVTCMNEMAVNWVLLTPSVAGLFSPEDVPLLQTLVLGGEALTEDNVNRWAGHVRLINCYGPAECAACAINDLSPGALPSHVGWTFGSNVGCLVDPGDHNRLVPIGTTSELVVEGPTLARGYLNNVRKTEAAFVNNPIWCYQTEPGWLRRIYKTGDLLRQKSDGSYTFVGRKDFQLKVRGQRVELAEIEHHLMKHPDLALSLVLRPAAGPFAKSLVAVVQLRATPPSAVGAASVPQLLSPEQQQNVAFAPVELADFLRRKLPSYMVPNHWLAVARIPFSASMKIDRKPIGAWLETLDHSAQNIVSEAWTTYKALLPDEITAHDVSREIGHLVARGDSKLYSSLLGRSFTLTSVGLDSIHAMSLSMFVRRRYAVRLTIGTILNASATVRSVAACIDKLRHSDSTQPLSLTLTPWLPSGASKTMRLQRLTSARHRLASFSSQAQLASWYPHPGSASPVPWHHAHHPTRPRPDR